MGVRAAGLTPAAIVETGVGDVHAAIAALLGDVGVVPDDVVLLLHKFRPVALYHLQFGKR